MMSEDAKAPIAEEVDADVENQVENEIAKTTTPRAAGGASKKRTLLVSLALLATTALVVGLAVGLTSGKNSNKSSNASAVTSNNNNNPDNQTTVETHTTQTTVTASLSTVGQQALVPYDSCQSLADDLTQALNILANSTIDSNAKYFYHWNESFGYGCIDCFGGGRPGGIIETAAAPSSGGDNSAGGSKGTGASSAAAGGESSYQTNNQVDGVDEPDIVKSNGVYVFAVYGNEIVVLDADNVTVLTRVKIAAPTIANYNVTIVETSPPVFWGGGDSGSSGGSTGSSSSTKAAIVEPSSNSSAFNISDYYNCYSSISSLLLHGDRLVAIGSGSCYFWGPLQSSLSQSILSDPEATKLYVYDISSILTNGVQLVAETATQGNYIDGRSIGSSAHIITSSYIDTWTYLTNDLSAYNWNSDYTSPNITESEYKARAYAVAQAKIPAFVSTLIQEVESLLGSTSCDTLVRFALYQTSDVSSTSAIRTLDFASSNILNTFTIVTSFDISSVTASSFVTDTAGVFVSSYTGPTYASDTRLFITSPGYHQKSDGTWIDETYLYGFKLGSATARADSVGKIPGYLIDQFSLDHRTQDGKDYLRTASTSSAQFTSSTNGNWNQVSNSTSQVYVLEIPADGAESRTLQVAGSITGIAPTETLYSVRFLGDRGFISTFKLTDPFFTIDLSNPTQPRLVGELKVSGFSSYLQPIANDTQILAIGQGANETTGAATGLQISLFDVTDLNKPVRTQFFTQPTSGTYGFAYSEAQYDHKAFRYLEATKVLIVPVQVWDYSSSNNFDGFVVYDVDATTGIKPRFSIEHANNNQIVYGCWSSAYLQARSLVFDGNLMTFKGHTILSHNLATHQSVAPEVNLDAGLPQTQCSGVYFY